MKICELLEMKGRLTLQKCNATNEVIETIAVNNHIVLGGRDLVAQLFIDKDMQPISHIAVGTGTTTVTDDDKALATELFRKTIEPVNLAKDLKTIKLTDPVRQVRQLTLSTKLESHEANGTLTEAGLFNSGNKADTKSFMYNRVTFPVINKTSDFTLTLIWEIQF